MSESFEVVTVGLRARASTLDELAWYSRSGGAACSYADRHLSLTLVDTAVLYALAIAETDKARAAILEMLGRQSSALPPPPAS